MRTLNSIFFKLSIMFLAQSTFLFSTTSQTIAAEKITLKYGIFSESVTSNQLEEFVLTGNLEGTLGNLLEQNTSLNLILQKSLKREIPIKITILDKALNHIVGEFFLDRIGQVIQMPAGGANKQAIRAALISSAQDNQISMLEVIKNYPDEELVVDIEKIEKLQDDVSRFVKFSQSVFSKT
jgi:hypothetical protein